jgi:tRNA(Arg) A34 adenosine deaminase TadA
MKGTLSIAEQAQAEGEYPVAAILVLEDENIARGWFPFSWVCSQQNY